MNNYEAVFIVNPDLENEALDEEVNKIKELVTKEEGDVGSVEAWGKRRLAYSIDKKAEAHYLLFTFKAKPASIKRMKDIFRLNDNIMRELIIKK